MFCVSCLFAFVYGATATVNFRGSGQLQRAQVTTALLTELATFDRRHAELEDELRPMFTSLPKNSRGNLGHDAVRSALHRYFVKKHGWYIKGLDPVAVAAAAPQQSLLDKDRIPEILEEAFEGLVHEKGANLKELASLAVALNDLILSETKAHLLDVYRALNTSIEANVSRKDGERIFRIYFTSFLVEHNWTVESKADLRLKEDIFARKYERYTKTFEFLGKWVTEIMPKTPEPVSFNHSMAVATKIGEEYHTLIADECVDLRTTLQSMESKRPGRVRLSAFYNKSLHTHYTFNEKVQTLRALGALDESDPKQLFVIISNYALSRPNCMNASNIYEVCCRNECEDIMNKLEGHVGSSTAGRHIISEYVSKLSSPSVHGPRNLSAALLDRLTEISEHHGGYVPLHGRLFAQWLHHAFPLECPYPAEAGSTNPSSWTGAEDQVASEEEMQRTVRADTCSLLPTGKLDCGEESLELPWSMNEQLLVTDSHPSASSDGMLIPLVLALLGIVVLVMRIDPKAALHRQRIAAVIFAVALYCSGLLSPMITGIAFVAAIVSVVVAKRAANGNRPLPITKTV